MRNLIKEIERRNVFKVALVYIIAGWLTMQVVDVMFPALKLPDWIISAVAAFVLIGFPFALIFAWAFEITPDGVKREKDVDRSESITPETGQKLNKIALIVLGIAVAFLLTDKFLMQETAERLDDSAVVAESKPSIAVLPFVNMSDDPANEYFSDGLSEELLNLLAKIPRLHVAGRTSSFIFKDSKDDLRSIGAQLNVAHVLEGSVRRSGARLRITAQLIDTETGYHLWSESYDRDLTDIFAIQDEIAANVVSALRVQLLGDEVTTTNRGTENIQAYNLVLQGNYFLEHTSVENIAKSFAAFEKAAELDPEFARAYLGMAVAVQQEVSGWAGSSGGGFVEGFERVREYADKAMAIDDSNSDAYVAQLVVAGTADWDMVAATRLGEKALELNPNNTIAMGWLASTLLFRGDLDGAIELCDELLTIEPLEVSALRLLGDAYAVSGEIELALETYRRALNLSPESSRLYGRIARAYLYEGNINAARVNLAREPVEWVRELVGVIILGREGKEEEWRAATIAFEEKYGTANSYQLAEIYADAGDLDETFRWLESTVAVMDPGAPWALIVPFFDEARKDPRWSEFESAFNL